MENNDVEIINNIQDRNSIPWKKLCEYIDELAIKGGEEFAPREALGDEMFAQIFTLPESIAKLKKVKKVWLYGSRLKRIPPEVGQMESLEDFDVYTSYDLHWFPFEIYKCKSLKDSRISTRALYGNYKNRMDFPSLEHNPVKYFGKKLSCSICDSDLSYESTNQLWITTKVGTDIVPLLANICSEDCKSKLPQPPKFYVEFPHKGGRDLKQPDLKQFDYIRAKYPPLNLEEYKTNKGAKSKFLKLKRKSWDK